MPDSFPRLRARTQRFTLGEPRDVTVSADGRRVLFLRAAAGDDPRTGLWALDLPAGEERPVIRAVADTDLSPQERSRRERVREGATGVVSYAADRQARIVAVTLGGQVHIADLAADPVTPQPLPGMAGAFDPRPDPTGRRVAYVAGSSLRMVDVDGGDDRLLAADGDEAVSWGRAEFVAAEEMHRLRGYWWAPDGESLLAARVDEAPVTRWWIADPAHPDTAPTVVRYPAAGTANADVTLWWLDRDGDRREIRWERDRFPYLGRVHWTETGPPLLAVVSRDQRTSRVLAVDVGDGSTRVLHEDTDDAWVELFDGVPAWFGDRVVRIADVDGARRLWVDAAPVTPPQMYVRSVAAVGPDGVVFLASDDDPTQVAVYRWSEDGVECLTPQSGVHRAASGGGTLVLASAGLDHVGVRTVVVPATGSSLPLTSYAVAPPLEPQVRMLELGPRRLRAGLLLPRDHVGGRKLPVLMAPYGGPAAQLVVAARAMWLEPQWLADQGFAVLVVDGRGTRGRDPAWDRMIHRDFATPVLDDQVEALQSAAAIEPDLDLSRVGIRGWSFGGYLAALAVLRRPDVFAAAVAGAPVTDWALYDTFYTERFLGTPQADPAAYEISSLLDDASSLTRPLLLIHGLADDNVVAAHTLRLSQRLTEAGRPHQVLPLTGVTHMTPQEAVAENLLVLQVEFLRRHLSG